MIRRLAAEGAGTFWIVFMGCGSSLLSAGYFASDLGLLGQPLMFGLALITASYLLGPISGAHFNPAVTVGFAVANRFPVRDLVPYIMAQVVGASVAALFLVLLMRERPGFEMFQSNLGANGYDAHSPGHYSLLAGYAVEAAMSFAFVTIKLFTSRSQSIRLNGPLMVGLALTLIYFFTTPLTGASINPARSTGSALLAGGDWALDQLWLFWAAPLTGGVLAGLSYPAFFLRTSKPQTPVRLRDRNDFTTR